MNKKGFTVVELLASFSIAMTILVVLFNVVIMMKDNLEDLKNKTDFLVMRDNLSYNINERFKEKELASLTLCEDGDRCYLFTYSDSTSDKLVYSATDKSITFNNYTFNITDDMKVESPTVTEHYDTMSSTAYNGYFILNIPITIDNNDYSIKVNKYFNTDSMIVDLRESIYDNDGNKYIPVEYIESTGTQYIDTGYKPSSKTKIEIKFSDSLNTDNSTVAGIFGGRTNNGDSSFSMWKFGEDDFRFDYSDTNYRTTIINDNNNYVIKWDKKDVYGYDKLLYSFGNKEFQSMSTLCIFGIKTYLQDYYTDNLPDSVDSRMAMLKLYYTKIYDNDTLVRDYIPVIDSSSRPCLFDKVSKECYYNQGTGEFLYG